MLLMYWRCVSPHLQSPREKTLGYLVCCSVSLSTSTHPCEPNKDYRQLLPAYTLYINLCLLDSLSYIKLCDTLFRSGMRRTSLLARGLFLMKSGDDMGGTTWSIEKLRRDRFTSYPMSMNCQLINLGLYGQGQIIRSSSVDAPSLHYCG
jgi:hypothetical protein